MYMTIPYFLISNSAASFDSYTNPMLEFKCHTTKQIKKSELIVQISRKLTQAKHS